MYTVCVADLRASRSPVYAYTGSPCTVSRGQFTEQSTARRSCSSVWSVFIQTCETPTDATHRSWRLLFTEQQRAVVRTAEVGYSLIVRSGSAFLANRSNKQAICQPRLSRSNCDSSCTPVTSPVDSLLSVVICNFHALPPSISLSLLHMPLVSNLCLLVSRILPILVDRMRGDWLCRLLTVGFLVTILFLIFLFRVVD